MDDQEGTYAPRSPDFSAYQSSFPPEPSVNPYYPPNQHHQLQQQHQQQQQQYQPPYIPPEPPFFGASAPLQPLNPYQPPLMPRSGKKQGYDNSGDAEWTPDASAQGGGRKTKKQKIEVACDKAAPGEKEGIEVKTKFPVARIKRIMQADEDVGKVAQVTPTAVSKALELFMISLVTKAAHEAKEKSSKRVTAAHLKQACERDEQWDFLASIMAKVPDAPTAKKDEDSEEMGEGKKKKGATRRRKKEPDDS